MKAKKIALVVLGLVVVVGLAVAVVYFEGDFRKMQGEHREARIKASTTDSFVVVHYHFKKNQRPHPADDDQENDGQEVLEHVMGRTSSDLVGVLLNGQGEILISEQSWRPENIDRITVTGLDGGEATAVEDRMLSHAQGQVLRLTGPLPAGWKPLSFGPAPQTVTTDTKLYGISLGLQWEGESEEKDRGQWYVSRCGKESKRTNQTDLPDSLNFYSGGSAVVVICEDDGTPVGATTTGTVELSDSSLVWRGADLLADPGFDRKAAEEKLRQAIGKYFYQVKVNFRPPAEKDDDDSGNPFYRFMPRGSENDKELYLYGLAVSASQILLPAGFNREMAASIDTLAVKIGEVSTPATFAGVLRSYDLTVLTLTESKFPAALPADARADAPRGEPFCAVRVRELAGPDFLIEPTRWFGKGRGDEGRWCRQLERDIHKGSWLFTGNGRLAGLYTDYKRDFNRLMPYLTGEGFRDDPYRSFNYANFRHTYRPVFFGRSSRYSDRGDMGFCDAATLDGLLKNREANLDLHVRHMTREEQKKRVWLGVEYTAVTREIAERLNIRRQTEDGRMGLIVNRVYRNSPAARLGIAEGDVILRLELPEAPWPIELKSYQSANGGRDYGEMDVPQEFSRLGYGPPRKRPWPNCDNPVTTMLLVVGEGVTGQLVFVHDGQEVRKEFTIEQAPPDSQSARKFKDEKLGLTVRGLTYEVRAALKLSDQDKAIVVSKVEPGTPASLARINRYELIRAVDGQEIASGDDFEAAIAKARQENKPSVRLTVEWMGRTRLADLKFEAQPQDLQNSLPGVVPPGLLRPDHGPPKVEVAP